MGLLDAYEHFSSFDGSVNRNLQTFDFEPVESNIKRVKYLEEYGPQPLLGEMIDKVGGRQSDWSAPSADMIINCLTIFRRFLLADNIEDKQTILLNKLGFDYSGTNVESDALYTYRFSTEPTHIELYLQSTDVGTLTEINRFNSSKHEEVKIPLSLGGVQYVFFQIFADLNRVDFNKLNINNFPLENQEEIQRINSLGDKYPAIDDIPVDKLFSYQLNGNNEAHFNDEDDSWLEDFLDTENTNIDNKSYLLMKEAPFIVFILMALADGEMDLKETTALAEIILNPRMFNNEFLVQVIRDAIPELTYTSIPECLSAIMDSNPDYLEKLNELRDAIDNNLAVDDALMFKQALIQLGYKIANASGGKFGFGSKVCKKEKKMLRTIALFLGVNN